jgi:hypothetical protein
MSWLRDAFNAVVAGGGAGRAPVLDDLSLPGWLEPRWGWNKERDLRRFRRVERMEKKRDVGKDTTKDR